MHNKLLTPLAATMLLAASAVSGQVTISTLGQTYTQNFSSLSWNAGETLGSWTNNSTLPGWSISNQNNVATSQYRPGWAGSQASNNLGGADATNYTKALQILVSGTQAGGDRVWDGNTRLGFRTGGTPANSFLTLQLTNTTGGALTSFSLGYEAAQFFASSTAALDVRYSFDNENWTTIRGTGGAAGDEDLRYITPTTGGNVAMTTAQIQDSITQLSATVAGISWENNSSLYIQFAFWRDLSGVASGSSSIMAIDDVSFSAIPEPSTYAAIFGALAFLGVVARRRFSKK
ncbi:MAG: PEP-CTERM sorting domain-containing protein [Verrucomicrobia bacterium]|nr:PEP-CTERM sorting domain-containing protein [Verrucomicrobiota bacterium]